MEHQPIQETPANEPTQSPMNQAPTANAANGGVDESYFNLFPPGYRFKPFDEELIVYYLQKKVNHEPLPPNKIHEVKLYQYNPETLAERYKLRGREKEWFFFTPRDRKYRNGQRPNRAAGDGYWKATGADRTITFDGATVGCKKALVFYKGKPPKGDKTPWIMHEFRVDNPPKCQRVGDDDMKLDDWVLCKIYKKADRPINTRDGNGDDGEHAPAENSSLASEESPVPNEPTDMDSGYNLDNVEPISPFHSEHLGAFAEAPQPFDYHHRVMTDTCYRYYANHPTPAPLSEYPIPVLDRNVKPEVLDQCPPHWSYKPIIGYEEELFGVSKLERSILPLSDYNYEQFVLGNGLPNDPVMLSPPHDVADAISTQILESLPPS